MSAKPMPDYKADLRQRYWAYQQIQFPGEQRIFDRKHTQDKGPPVFIPSEAWRNIIVNPKASAEEIAGSGATRGKAQMVPQYEQFPGIGVERLGQLKDP
jgi:hypothetical protein